MIPRLDPSLAFLPLIAVLLTGSIPSEGRAGAPKPLLFLGDKDYPPIAFLDEGGVARGMEVDLIAALARAMNREIHIELTDWNLSQEKLVNGEADGLIGMSITDKRKEQFDFANPTFTHEFSLLVRSGDLTIRGVGDLK